MFSLIDIMITRLELYQRVWREPMVNIAKEFGVSSSYLARICSRLNVPRPARGYWAQVSAGQHMVKRPLPEARPGDEISWNPSDGRCEIQKWAQKTVETPNVTKRARKRNLDEQHELIVDMKPIFLAGNLSRDGSYLKPSKRNLLDLVVTSATLSYALELANALFLAFERKGHRVVLAHQNESISRPDVDTRDIPTKQTLFNNLWSPGRKTVLYLNGNPVGITLFEITDATAMRYNGNGKYIKETDFVARKGVHMDHLHWKSIQDMPSGRLCVQIYTSNYDVKWSRQWKEPRPQELLKKINTLVNEVLACEAEVADAINKGKQHADAEKARWNEMQEKWQTEELERKRAKAIKESREELESLLVRSEKCDRLDRFLATFMKQAVNASEASKARLEMLIDAAMYIEGARPKLDDFLAWKPPHERD
ncbi:hypothetical protein [Massilia sp. YIM B02443]|uniref:hypothetical protein n=1 Tax=Massilia sp. YIM B02443 TaxID=3050127 RepID=UPI0025B68CB3|nr:hypothetical protein [Massilia sp. YIM B02443]MDN4039307.1 hypothetical protein [Massilia sp. YIM B02443]